jgi:biopolymer transport protein ExbD
MRLTSRKLERGRKIELTMTSMIDVVFLLLIFFMTTSSFVRTERNLESAIKDQQKAASSAASDLEPAVVELVPSGGRFVYRVGSRELVAASELTDLLRQFPNKVDGAFVRVSDGAPFSMAAAAVQACKDADFTAVAYVPLD